MLEYFESLHAADPFAFGIMLIIVGWCGMMCCVNILRYMFRNEIEEYKKKHKRL